MWAPRVEMDPSTNMFILQNEFEVGAYVNHDVMAGATGLKFIF